MVCSLTDRPPTLPTSNTLVILRCIYSNQDLIWCVKIGGIYGFLGTSWVLITTLAPRDIDSIFLSLIHI